MNMHYCNIFGDCCHCPAPYCPYEKLEPDWLDYIEGDEDDDEKEGEMSEV